MIKMAWHIKVQRNRSDELSGLIEYYDAIFNREDLIKKESDFRSNKLSLILDLIRATGTSDATGISDNPGTDLSSSIINAWRLQVPEKTLIQRNDELRIILSSIENIKNGVKGIYKHKEQSIELQLSAVVFSCLPIMPTDFHSEEVAKIYDLINQVWEYTIYLIDDKLVGSKINIISGEAALDSIS
jgi:hypothetical protein